MFEGRFASVRNDSKRRRPCMQVLCKPGTQQARSRFEAELHALTQAEGGRHTPFFSDYRPQLFIRTADIPGVSMIIEPT